MVQSEGEYSAFLIDIFLGGNMERILDDFHFLVALFVQPDVGVGARRAFLLELDPIVEELLIGVGEVTHAGIPNI